MSQIINAVRIPALKSPAKAAIIFCHGLGDSGNGWSFFSQLVKQTGLIKDHDSINYVFPNAPQQPVSLNFGMVMPSWFDIFGLGPDAKQDPVGFMKSVDILKQLIKEQTEKYNIPPNRIIIGGFSQGAALSLATLATLDYKIGGVVALLGFAQAKEKVTELHNSANYNTPVFQGHGTVDDVVNFEFGKATSKYYQDMGFKNWQFKEYAGVPHSASEEELNDAMNFINKVLTENNAV